MARFDPCPHCGAMPVHAPHPVVGRRYCRRRDGQIGTCRRCPDDGYLYQVDTRPLLWYTPADFFDCHEEVSDDD